ncbi:MAG: hypothetical protein ABIO17_09385, partial [Pseudoxanthomonas sp.]
MITPRPKLLSAAIAATLFVASPHAFAQQATPTAAPTNQTEGQANDALQLDTITVTARGISESLQKTPLPISVISSKQIEEKGLVNV